MKIKNGALELLQKNKTLTKLFESKEIPIEVSFRLAEFARNVKPHVKLYLDMKYQLVNKFADKDSTGKIIMQNNNYMLSKHKKEFVQEFTKLCELEIDLEKPIIELGQWAQGTVNAIDIRELYPLIEFKFNTSNG